MPPADAATKAKEILPAYPTDLVWATWIAVVVVAVFAITWFIDMVWIKPRAARNAELERQELAKQQERREERQSTAKALERKEERDSFLTSLEKVTSSHRETVTRIMETHEESTNRLHSRLDDVEQQIISRAEATHLKIDTIMASIHAAPVVRVIKGMRSSGGPSQVDVVAPHPEPTEDLGVGVLHEPPVPPRPPRG